VEPSSGGGDGITVARVETDAQFDQVREVFEQGDGWSPGDEWLRGPGFVTRYLAFIDGRPVATADITWLADERAAFLGGALTLPEFRGRGAYRALVHERWREAGHRGRDVLVTQSEPMSQPILKRLGFEVVGEISVLIDRF
jgi:GNAT superfamily N-acetyltransferase